jgi:hypothetical protein
MHYFQRIEGVTTDRQKDAGRRLFRLEMTDLKDADTFAQSVGATVTREFTAHNMIERVARQHQAALKGAIS